jgi:hypothetical protein
MLQVVGDAIVDSNGRKTVLKGAGLGGHLNMEVSIRFSVLSDVS